MWRRGAVGASQRSEQEQRAARYNDEPSSCATFGRYVVFVLVMRNGGGRSFAPGWVVSEENPKVGTVIM
jgi:hypothetical protein